MTQLAVRGSGNGAIAQPGIPLASSAALTLQEVWQMAEYVFESQLFPVKNAQQAFTLMMLAQSEGLHPIQAMRRYDIIDNKPCLKSAALQAEFQRLGGVIKAGECSPVECNATFSHPTLQPTPIALKTTFEHYKRIGLTGKKNWLNDPEAMLWWRLIAKGVRRIYPGIVVGIYTEDEVRDEIASETASVQIAESKEQARSAVASADEPIPGHDPRQPDTRRFWAVASEAVAATNGLVAENWGTLPGPPEPMQTKRLCNALANKAVSQGKAEGPVPPKAEACVRFLDKVYASDRQWVRSEVRQACQEHAEAAAEALGAARGATLTGEEDGHEPLSDEDAAELAGVEDEPRSGG